MNDLWPAIWPKRLLHPEFRLAIRVSFANARREKMQRMRGDAPTVRGLSATQLTVVADFPHTSEITRVLSAKPFSATPLTVGRLKAMAKAVGYSGELFAEETETEPVAAAHGARL